MKNNKLKPPAHLSAESKVLWRKLVQDYEIDDAAGMILVATLEAKDRREQARQALAAEGSVQVDRFGQRKPSPWVAIERDAAMTTMRGFRLLGMDLAQSGAPKGRF